MNLEVTRLAGSLGAELRGIDLARATASDAERIRALLVEHCVLFFPEQPLSIEQHVALGRLFGPLEAHPHLKNPYTQHPELFELAATQRRCRRRVAHGPHLPRVALADVAAAHGEVPAGWRRHAVDEPVRRV